MTLYINRRALRLSDENPLCFGLRAGDDDAMCFVLDSPYRPGGTAIDVNTPPAIRRLPSARRMMNHAVRIGYA